MEVERTMSGQLQSLKLQLQRKGGHSRQQDEELISAMKEQVTTVGGRRKKKTSHTGCTRTSERWLWQEGEKCVSFGDNPALAGSKWPEHCAPHSYFPIRRCRYQPPAQSAPCCTQLLFRLQVNLQLWVLVYSTFVLCTRRTLQSTINI